MNSETYVITQDTKSVMGTIFSEPLDDSNEDYFIELAQALNIALPSTVDLTMYRENTIEDALGVRVREIIDSEPNSIFIIFDRFLGAKLELDPSTMGSVARFSITRAVNGTKVPRPGNSSFELQIQKLLKRFPDLNVRPVYLVDDGFFTGGTVMDFKTFLADAGVNLNLAGAIGFIGNGVSSQVVDIPLTILNKVDDLYEWIDIRDFGIFGGKRLDAGKMNLVASAIPYIAPWSDGAGASLNKSPRFFEISKRMINAQIALLRAYVEQAQKNLTFRDLINAGFAFPTNFEKTIPVSLDMDPIEYLERCIQLIEAEEQREVFIFDMDGTLYELDGENKGFEGSSLQQEIERNAIRFICEKENIDEASSVTIFEEAKSDPIGASAFLSRKYGISREAYFDVVWNVDPTNILKTDSLLIEWLRSKTRGSIGSNQPKLVLLTSAPRVWMNNVISTLGLTNIFEVTYTAENFGTKADIFQILAGRYQTNKITSIGDQMKSDIIPAQELGFNTCLVDGPAAVIKFLLVSEQ